MKLTLRKKLGRWAFVGQEPPLRIFPARKGRAELQGPRDRSARPASILHEWWAIVVYRASARARRKERTAR